MFFLFLFFFFVVDLSNIIKAVRQPASENGQKQKHEVLLVGLQLCAVLWVWEWSAHWSHRLRDVERNFSFCVEFFQGFYADKTLLFETAVP